MSLVFHLMWTGSRLCSFLLHLSAIKIGPGLERRCLENTGRNNLKSKQLEGVDNNILQSFLEILKQRRQWKNGLTEGPHIHPPTPAPHDGMGSCRHSDMELLFRKRTCSSILCGKLLSASHTLHDLHASRVPYVTGVSSGAPGIHKWGGVLKHWPGGWMGSGPGEWRDAPLGLESKPPSCQHTLFTSHRA